MHSEEVKDYVSSSTILGKTKLISQVSNSKFAKEIGANYGQKHGEDLANNLEDEILQAAIRSSLIEK